MGTVRGMPSHRGVLGLSVPASREPSWTCAGQPEAPFLVCPQQSVWGRPKHPRALSSMGWGQGRDGKSCSRLCVLGAHPG